MKYYLIAGEASGDLHASNLMRAIKEQDPKADFRFFGGDLMQAQGGKLVKHYREMAFMGFISVIANIDKVFSNLRQCKKDITAYRPDILILIDYPGFNLKIAKFAKKTLNIPVCYYISPKIWAWKEYRIKTIKKYIDLMLCILPFEVDFYRKHNFPVTYVGNPTADELSERPYADETFKKFCDENNLNEKPIIALLAGSRRQEIKANLPDMIKAVSEFPGHQAVIAGAPGIEESFYSPIVANTNISVVFGKTYRLLQQSEAALVTSGTATLETALLQIPQVVCYQIGGGRFTYELFKRILSVPYISLVNLIANKEVVKELVAHLFSASNMAHELNRILNDKTARSEMQEGYETILRRLGTPGAANRAAQKILSTLNDTTKTEIIRPDIPY